MLVAACGGSGDDDAPESDGASTTAPASDAGPEDLAREMVGRYEEMNEMLLALIEQDLPAADLAPEIAALKDDYIDIFVAMGHQREAMSDEEVASFNSTALLALNDVSQEHIDAMNALLTELNAAGEYDLAGEINSLNILTQYAQFELLWGQDPEEAERLDLPSPLH
jgi:hypothetical protein